MSPYRTVVIPEIDYARCQSCAPCVAAKHCRFRAIVRIEHEEPPYIDVSRCEGCGDCAPHCAHEAIHAPSPAV